MRYLVTELPFQDFKSENFYNSATSCLNQQAVIPRHDPDADNLL